MGWTAISESTIFGKERDRISGGYDEHVRWVMHTHGLLLLALLEGHRPVLHLELLVGGFGEAARRAEASSTSDSLVELLFGQLMTTQLSMRETRLDLTYRRYRYPLQDQLRHSVPLVDYAMSPTNLTVWSHEGRLRLTLKVRIRVIEEQDHQGASVIRVDDTCASLDTEFGGES
jgi:hypothetical protein